MSNDPKEPDTPIRVLAAAIAATSPLSSEERQAELLAEFGARLVEAVKGVVQAICDDRDREWKHAIDLVVPSHHRERIIMPAPRRLM